MRVQKKRIVIVGSTVKLFFDNGQFTLIDRQDMDLVNLNWRLAKIKEYAGGNYRYHVVRNIRVDGKQTTVSLHRTILARMLGRELSPKEMTDHRRGQTLDNRRSEIRLADYSQNAANINCRADSKTGVKGVKNAKTPGKYIAQIKVHGTRYHLGTFSSAEDASTVYSQAARLVWGEFARVDYQVAA